MFHHTIAATLGEWAPTSPEDLYGLTDNYLNRYQAFFSRTPTERPAGEPPGRPLYECTRCECPPGNHELYTPDGQYRISVVIWFHQLLRAIRWLIDKGADPGAVHARLNGVMRQLEQFDSTCLAIFADTPAYRNFLRDGVAQVMVRFAHRYHGEYPTSKIIEVLRLAPDLYTDLILIGELHLHAGDTAAARASFAEAVDTFKSGPNFNIAMNYLAAMSAGCAIPNEHLHDSFPAYSDAGCWICGDAGGCNHCRPPDPRPPLDSLMGTLSLGRACGRELGEYAHGGVHTPVHRGARAGAREGAHANKKGVLHLTLKSSSARKL